MWKRRQDCKLLAVLASLMFIAAVLYIHKPLTWALLLIGLGVSVVIAIRTRGYGRKMYEAASATLGVEVSRSKGQSPPAQSPAYEQWCAARGLTPYSASIRLPK